MLLRTLEVLNFRQFNGRSKLVFAGPGAKNITLILGENGAGKSTLLNAFRWCLYGKIEMENEDEIVSHQAMYDAAIGDRVTVEVVLQFDHDSVAYTAIRSQEYEKVEGGHANPIGEAGFQASKIGADGESETLNDPVWFVRNLLPENLSRFFFFQGESILQLALQRSRRMLCEGVETFLDFKVLDRAVRHLEVVERDIDRELKQSAGKDLAHLQDEILDIKSKIDGYKSDIEQLSQNVLTAEAAAEEMRQRLSEVEKLQPILRDIVKLQEHAAGRQRERNRCYDELRSLLSRDAFLAVAPRNLLEVPIRLAEQAVSKGELPAKIKPGFVTDLLDAGECVCGEPITDKMRGKLEQWKGKVGLADLEATVDGLRRDVFRYRLMRVDSFRESQKTLRLEIAELDDEIRTTLERKSRKKHELGTTEVSEPEIEELRDAYQRKLEEIAGYKAKRGLANERVQTEEVVLNEKIAARAKLVKKKSKEDVLEQRSKAARNVRHALEQIRTDWSGFVQEYLDGLLKKSWSEVAQLPRRVSFTPEFVLTIEERGGSGDWVTSAPSEANCAVLALTFVAALIEFASEIGKEQQGSMFSGGDFPIVMDAPFAKMDEEFKQKVPPGLSHAVPQVVLISSVDQWRGDVADGVENHVGKGYVLALHKPGENSHVRKVNALGREVDYVVTEEGIHSDWSSIEEIGR